MIKKMLKSRKALFMAFIATILASVGAIMGSILCNTKILALLTLIMMAIGVIYQFCTEKGRKKRLIDFIVIFFIGAIMGSIKTLPFGGFIISLAIGAGGLFLLMFGFTGHKKEEKVEDESLDYYQP